MPPVAQKPAFLTYFMIFFFKKKILLKRFEGWRKLFVGCRVPENQLKCKAVVFMFVFLFVFCLLWLLPLDAVLSDS